MKKIKLVLGIAVLVTISLAACSSNQPVNDVMEDPVAYNSSMMDESIANTSENSSDNSIEGNQDAMKVSSGEIAEGETEDMADSSHNQSETMEEGPEIRGMGNESEETLDSDKPSWYTHEFYDSATGETFRISDFKGSKVVLVETLALWCSNCLRQQQEVKKLHSLLGERDDFVSVGINIDSREDLVMVAMYVKDNEFDWLYGVAPDEIIGNISETLGGQFLNPPSTPIVLIDKEGNQFPLPFGIKTADTLLSYVEEHLN